MYGLAIRSTFPDRVRMSRMVFRGMAIGSLLPAGAGAGAAGRRPSGPGPADLPDRLVHLLGHQRLAPAGDLGGVRVEDVLADPPEHGIARPGSRPPVGEEPAERAA